MRLRKKGKKEQKELTDMDSSVVTVSGWGVGGGGRGFGGEMVMDKQTNKNSLQIKVNK